MIIKQTNKQTNKNACFFDKLTKLKNPNKLQNFLRQIQINKKKLKKSLKIWFKNRFKFCRFWIKCVKNFMFRKTNYIECFSLK